MVSSQYWNGVHGFMPDDVKKDEDGLHWEVWLIDRGDRQDVIPKSMYQIIGDINDKADVADPCWKYFRDKIKRKGSLM